MGNGWDDYLPPSLFKGGSMNYKGWDIPDDEIDEISDPQLREMTKLLRLVWGGSNEDADKVQTAIDKRKFELGIQLPADHVLISECECGKEKHNFMRHSSWCPKWSRS